MTAIGGLWRFDGTGGVRPMIERMSSGLESYGRDRAGLWLNKAGDIGLLWRQFAVLPEDLYDRQPLSSADGVHTLVADVRIDNRDELIDRLALTAPASTTLPDSAIVLSAYRKWGVDCLTQLVGNFAFALWDSREGSLFLARDILGHKPLYFGHGNGFFAFSSMPRGLFALPEISKAVNETELAAYLALLPQSGTPTIYLDLQRIPPGCGLLVQGQRHRLWRYWQPDPQKRLHLSTYSDYVDGFREVFTQAVRSCLRATSGIGSHLSAGYDSSAVTAVAAGLLAAQGKRLTAFTAVPRTGFARNSVYDREVDEALGAARVVDHLGTVKHVLISSASSSHLRTLEPTLSYLDLPVTNPCNHVWLSAINAEANRRRVKVILTGAAGNMTISHTGMTHLAYLFGRAKWVRLAALIVNMMGNDIKLAEAVRAAIGPFVPAVAKSLLQKSRGRDDSNTLSLWTALSPALADRVDIQSIARARGWDLSHRPWSDGWHARMATLQRVDNGAYNMACAAETGVEVRDPTADRRVVEFCLAVPEEHYINRGRPSSLLRDAMAGILPDDALNRRVRGLQAADWYEGVVAARDELGREIERLANSPTASRVLDIERLRSLITMVPEPGSAAATDPEYWRGPAGRCRAALLRGVGVGRVILRAEGRNA